ncbi:hypothetical protein [Acidovorax sp. SUPP3334]|nr:hypothetical protein [Acidovorax sp. SUPP3334]GKT22737.1 hypothetical protein AVHM3334_09380 [Acidovorax sp. SUPP3334]
MNGVALQVLLAWLVIFLPLGAAGYLVWWLDRARASPRATERPLE